MIKKIIGWMLLLSPFIAMIIYLLIAAYRRGMLIDVGLWVTLILAVAVAIVNGIKLIEG